MIPFSRLLIFLAAGLGLLLVPGPAVLYITTRGITQGRKASLVSMLGIEVGSLGHTVAAAFGLSAILLASATAFHIVKYLGAGYLIYLGIRTLISKKAPLQEAVGPARSLRHLFRKGVLVNLLNPKNALFFYAFLPQFVDPRTGSPVLQILLLGAMFVALATITDSAYAVLSSKIGEILLTWRPFQRIHKFVTGGIYISLGIGAALTGSTRE